MGPGVPVYSVLEGVEEVVDSISQSFSPLRLPADGQEEKPPAESGLGGGPHKHRNYMSACNDDKKYLDL